MSRIMEFAATHNAILSDQHPYASHGVVNDAVWETEVTLARRTTSEGASTTLYLTFMLRDNGEDMLEARLRINDRYPDGSPAGFCNRHIGSVEAMTQSIRDHLKRRKYPVEAVDKEAPQALLAFVESLHGTLGHTFYASLKAEDYDATYGAD